MTTELTITASTPVPLPGRVKKAPRLSGTHAVRCEPISPFVPWSPEDRASIPEESESDGESALLVDLLRNPTAIVTRLLDPNRVQATVLGSLVTTVAGTAFFATTCASSKLGISPFVSAAIVPLNVLLALAAALGPIYATGLVVAARLPLARLVGTVLSASATGALILAAISPLPYWLFKMDAEWGGPLALIAAFLVTAIASGARMRRILYEMAEEVARRIGGEDAKLSEADQFRVGILARMAMVFVAFTTALSLWAFDAFV